MDKVVVLFFNQPMIGTRQTYPHFLGVYESFDDVKAYDPIDVDVQEWKFRDQAYMSGHSVRDPHCYYSAQLVDVKKG